MSETLICEDCGAEATKVTADDVDLCAECYERCIAEYVEIITGDEDPTESAVEVSDTQKEAAGLP